MAEIGHIFGIGLTRTGTTSFAAAMNMFGIPALHDARRMKRIVRGQLADGRRLLPKLLKQYRCLADSPIQDVYKKLDLQGPGSKFVLTVRDVRDWLVSRITRFGKTAEHHASRWRAHHAEVREYFAQRPQDLLIYKPCDGDGWSPLCKFLGWEIPDEPFPHENASRPASRTQVALLWPVEIAEAVEALRGVWPLEGR